MLFGTLDIETITPRWEPPEDDPDRFPGICYHEPVCIGLLVGDEQGNVKCERTRLIREPGEEAEAIGALGVSLESLAGLITYNGRGFDVPVLSIRAMMHKATTWSWLGSRRYRFGGWHCDVYDWLSDYGAARSMKLGELGEVLGLGEKTADGSQVAEMIADGRWEELAEYCAQDVRITYQLAIRAHNVLGMPWPSRGKR